MYHCILYDENEFNLEVSQNSLKIKFRVNNCFASWSCNCLMIWDSNDKRQGMCDIEKWVGASQLMVVDMVEAILLTTSQT